MRRYDRLIRVTYVCDQCGAEEIRDLTAGQEEEETIGNKTYLPSGWHTAHVDKPNVGDNMATHCFCSSNCKEMFLEELLRSVRTRFNADLYGIKISL